VEWLTDKMEEEAMKYIDRIDSMGGMIEAVKKGFPQREIAESAYRFQKEVEEKKRIIVGVNEYIDENEKLEIPLLRVDPEVVRVQLARLKRVKETRDNERVKRLLSELRKAAERNENVMPYVLNAVKAYATLGEIMGVLKEVYGEYQELIIF